MKISTMLKKYKLSRKLEEALAKKFNLDYGVIVGVFPSRKNLRIYIDNRVNKESVIDYILTNKKYSLRYSIAKEYHNYLYFSWGK